MVGEARDVFETVFETGPDVAGTGGEMSAIEQILEATKESLSAADAGDPTPCFDGSVQGAEVLVAVLELVREDCASKGRVEEVLSKIMERW